MKKDMKDVLRIKEEFQNEYIKKSPMHEYVRTCGISNLKLMKKDGNITSNLKANESIDDYCLFVGLREYPPQKFKFPEEYKGIRICYNIVGKVVPE